MGHPNLSDNINALIKRSSQPGDTLNLRDVEAGAVVEIVFGKGKAKSTMSIRIDKLAGPGWGEDSAEGIILKAKFQLDKKKSFKKANLPISLESLRCAIVGACTRNPGSPLGMTMLHIHRITKDRHLLWYTQTNTKDEVGWLFPETVSSFSVKR